MIRDRREEFKDVLWRQGYLILTLTVLRMPKDWRAEANATEKRRAFAFFSPFDEGRSREFVFEFETAEECAAAVAEHNKELRERLKPNWPPSEEEIQDAKVPTAVLCALMWVMTIDEGREFTPFMKKAFRQIDWKQTGVKYHEFVAWWERHRQRDLQRRVREQEEARQAEAREAALAKLSKAERRLLGLE